MISLREKDEISKLKESAIVLVNAFKAVFDKLEAGIKTKELDQVVEKEIKHWGAIPAFKGYRGFPASICVSINDEVVHGIPGDRIVQEGDIVSIDMGVKLNGFFSDAARTFKVGKISEDKKRLLQVTKKSLYLGIEEFQKGNRLSDISHKIQSYVEKKGFSIVRELVGHGIGTSLHEDPQIPNYGSPHHGPLLKAGMVFAIEPMVNMGEKEILFDDDGWTVRTLDKKPSAHFEHTVLLTENGPEILTIDIEELD
ncbi:MAG: type I methionyl aminopeptidase [bacterium]